MDYALLVGPPVETDLGLWLRSGRRRRIRDPHPAVRNGDSVAAEHVAAVRMLDHLALRRRGRRGRRGRRSRRDVRDRRFRVRGRRVVRRRADPEHRHPNRREALADRGRTSAGRWGSGTTARSLPARRDRRRRWDGRARYHRRRGMVRRHAPRTPGSRRGRGTRASEGASARWRSPLGRRARVCELGARSSIRASAGAGPRRLGGARHAVRSSIRPPGRPRKRAGATPKGGSMTRIAPLLAILCVAAIPAYAQSAKGSAEHIRAVTGASRRERDPRQRGPPATGRATASTTPRRASAGSSRSTPAT